MSRYRAMFERLDQHQAGAFVPFCVLGDPTAEQSLANIGALIAGGADALELGIPFSDPVADGPTIQAAAVRALAANTRPADAFEVIGAVRAVHPDVPVGLLVYANLVEARGRDDFYARAAAAGVDSVLIADVPTVEAPPFIEAATRAGIDAVMIATPNAGDHELATIASMSQGYTYVVTRVGVTGAEAVAGGGQTALLERLASLGAPPCLLGFGISTPEHVRAAMVVGAAGAISGSAVVRIIEAHLDDPDLRHSRLATFTRKMKAATLSA